MRVSPLHLRHQGPVLEALLRTALGSIARRVRPGASPGGSGAGQPEAGARGTRATTVTLPPRDAGLVRDFITAMGGDPAWYGGQLPPHLFPQWGFALISANLRGLPYDLPRMLNAGVKLEVRGPLPAHEPLEVTARLETVDANERRVIFPQRLVTGTASAPEAIVAEVTGLIPGKRREGAGGGRDEKERPVVPAAARELDRWDLGPNAGLEFALLTGDLNPIHWLKPYARLAGFSSPILHGFGLFARTIESLNRRLWAGDVARLASLEARFVRPLALPARPGVFLDGQGAVYVGDAPGAPACMVGRFTERESTARFGA